MIKRGWLAEQFEDLDKEIKSWPAWMRRAAGLKDTAEAEKVTSPTKKEVNLEEPRITKSR